MSLSRRIVPWPCVMSRANIAVRTMRANIAGVMAVGRDVPIAPHRPVAVGNAPWVMRVRIIAVRTTRANIAGVMRVGNGSAIGTSRRVRGLAAHRAAGWGAPTGNARV